MAQAHFIIIGVMSGSNFYRPGAKFRVHIIIGNNRRQASRQGQPDLFAYQPCIAVVLRINRHGSVSQHCFRPGSSHYHMAATVSQGISEIPKGGLCFLMFHFNIREGSLTAGAPVDNVFPLINQALFIQAHKHFPHRPGTALVQGKAFPGPVAGNSHLLKLGYNPGVILFFPFPHLGDKLFPAKIMAT